MVKNFMQKYTWVMVLACGVLAGACSEDVPTIRENGEETSSEVQFRVKTVGNESVSVTSRAGDDDPLIPRNNFPQCVDFIEEKSRIRVCSVDRNPETEYGEPDMDTPYLSDTDKPTYFHEYICNEKVDYDQYSIFTSYKDSKPLRWDDVDEFGNVIEGSGNILKTSVAGGYYLYAIMFPYRYVPFEGSVNGRRFVSENQTYQSTDLALHGHFAANLLKNDVRLCYKMFGRDKFREPIRLDFYHSLCMLVVNVELPRFNKEDGTGFTDEEILNAKSMSVNNIYRSYKANYTKAYDQNDPVEVSVYSGSDAIFGKVDMFHTPNFSNFSDKEGPFEEEDAIWNQDVDHTGAASSVAWTQFCAILPPQRLSDSDPYISFEIGGKKFRCKLSGYPAVPLQQTYVTTLTLYIPREESDPIIIGAHLNDWVKHRTPIIPLQ